MTTAPPLTHTDIADILTKAETHITRFGYCKYFLYSTTQARNGVPITQCAVDVIGAITTAVHGTPRHLGHDPRTQAAEHAVKARITAPSITAWCSYPGNGKNEAIWLLRHTARQLRKEAS